MSLKFILARCISTLSVMLIVALLCFILLRLAPADPASILAGENAPPGQLEAVRQSLGLDRPLPVQFLTWILALLKGDLGESFFFKQPVSSLIVARIGPTIALAFYATLITIVVAVPLGIVAAKWQDSIADRLIMSLAVFSFSLPVFVVGYCLIFVFSISLGLFPVQGYQPLQNGFGGFLYRLTLPAIASSLPYIALITRMTRASVLGVLKEDYIRAARAKGQSELKVLFRHALKNAAVPIITSISAGIAFLLGGVVVTESVFNLPGLGRLTVDAVLAGDYPIIQSVVLLFAFMIVVINLATDLIYKFVDPRIKY